LKLENDEPNAAAQLLASAKPELYQRLLPNLRNNLYKTYAKIYFEQRNTEKFRDYYLLYTSFRDSVNTVRTKASFQMIEELPYQQDTAALSEQEKLKRTIWILAGVLIFIIAAGSLTLINMIENQRKFRNILQRIEKQPQNKNLQRASETSRLTNLPEPSKLDTGDFHDDENKAQILPENTEQQILSRLEQFEKSHHYLQPNITLQSLAKTLDTNTKYLSFVINSHKNSNFNHYLNELRINYIILKLKNEPRYRKYKISYLATEAGFTSQSSFATVFKTITGLSPSIFISYLNLEKDA